MNTSHSFHFCGYELNRFQTTQLAGVNLSCATSCITVVAWIASAFGCMTVADAQTVVYRPVVPMFAPAAGPYVTNYTPAGNYAAVTAFSPPMMEAMPMPVAPMPIAAMVPSSSNAVTSYYAPPQPTAMTAYYAPATAYYAPTTAYYAPAPAYYAPSYATPVYSSAQVTAYYAPTQIYRRGLFGAYRPVRSAYYYPGY